MLFPDCKYESSSSTAQTWMLARPASVNYFQKLGFIHSLGSTTRLWFYFGTLYLCSDETQFRNCIVWLEDQKIRHYKIEDRGNLRNIPSSDWPKAYQKVRKAPSITLHATISVHKKHVLVQFPAF